MKKKETKTDCRFYTCIDAQRESCTALKKLYCEHGSCNFYKPKTIDTKGAEKK